MAATPSGLLSILAVGLAVPGHAASDSTCGADGENCSQKYVNRYFWPHMHGNPDYYGNPPWSGPTDLPSSFKWRWNGPGKLYEESFVAAVIDDKKDIYVLGDFHAYKLSPDGQLIWTYKTPGQAAADSPTIMDGSFYGDTVSGNVYAVDMETGEERWVTQATEFNGGQYGGIAAHNGVVVTQGEEKKQVKPWPDTACGAVRGLNGTDGRVLWAYQADNVLWDWFPQFPDDDSVIFMEQTGLLVRLGLKDGSLVWKSGGIPDTWTDGAQFVAPNGLVYSVSVDQTLGPCPKSVGGVDECPGIVAAHKVSDGSLVWKRSVPKPPNTAPVVGRLGKDDRLSLAMPIGQQTGGCQPEAFRLWAWMPFLKSLPDFAQKGIFAVAHTLSVRLGDDYNWILWGAHTVRHDVLVFDAETGEPQWHWDGPVSHFCMAPGDRDGFIPRFKLGLRPISCPTPWNAPRVGSDGTLYVGNQNGGLYAVRDADGDGLIDDATEVSVYHTRGVFTHEGTAHAPGMIVAVNFDSVFVFKS